jgi:hypothetical protein
MKENHEKIANNLIDEHRNQLQITKNSFKEKLDDLRI